MADTTDAEVGTEETKALARATARTSWVVKHVTVGAEIWTVAS